MAVSPLQGSFFECGSQRCSKTGTAVSGSGRPMASPLRPRKAHRVSNVVLRTVARHDPLAGAGPRGNIWIGTREVGSSAFRGDLR